MTRQFVWPVRVYWEDTDAGGIVYYANYLKFMERARTEWLRALGIEQIPLQEQHGIMLVIAGVEVDYRRPAKYGDMLQVTCRVVEHGKVSLAFEQNIYRAATAEAIPQSEWLIQGKARVACVHATTFKPRALPEMIVRELEP